jgi:hypothetical protein
MQEFFALISRSLLLILLPQQLNKPKSKRMMALFSTLNPNPDPAKAKNQKGQINHESTKRRKHEKEVK